MPPSCTLTSRNPRPRPDAPSPAPQYKQTVGDKEVCADGNATDNWDTPPEGGWGYYNNGTALRDHAMPLTFSVISASAHVMLSLT